MEFVTLASASAFLDLVEADLLEREAENNLILGVAMQVREAGTEAFFAAAVDRGRVVAAVSRTPPRAALLTRGPPEALQGLGALVAANDPGIPGVLGIDGEVELFASEVARRTGKRAFVESRQRGYELTNLVEPAGIAGHLRPCTSGEHALLAEWLRRFSDEAHIEPIDEESSRAEVEKRAAASMLFVWDDGGVVSMASLSRPTRTGIAVNYVYTPAASRGRGYAKACVAALGARVLAEGRRACFLNADLANPISNRVYLAIGYVPVADWAKVELVVATG